jgi:dienelactone hydrolase
MLGAYGLWAATLAPDGPAPFSLRHARWNDVDAWRAAARQRLTERLAMPDTGGVPTVSVESTFEYDGLHMELLSWQLRYGPRTQALFLKPAGASGPLPGVVALHDHGGNKFFGWQKITRTRGDLHPNLLDHQDRAYGDTGWANELAKRGYAVLVPDAYAFGSRRLRIADVPEVIRNGLNDADWADDPQEERSENIEAYNRWAGGHETIMAKSLFSAGTTWPGVWLSEDLRALDVLCAREDVDAARVGCGGLSGGGLRTVFLAGMDDRIRCAACVGMMTTWRDYALHKSHTHTWMIYVPLLPNELDYPEILGLRAPLPTLVQNNNEDPLFTLPEMRRADGILREVYAKADAADRYRCSYYPGPHKFDREMQAEAFDWFDQWL